MDRIHCFSEKKGRTVEKTPPFLVEVVDHNLTLPKHVERCVAEDWNVFAASSPEIALDSDIHFVKDCSFGENISLKTHTQPFRYAQSLSKTKGNDRFLNVVNEHRLIPFSSHSYLITADNKAVFGIKRNLSGQISAFAGYPKGVKYL